MPPTPTSAENGIAFPDKNLEEAIRFALGKDWSEAITAVDLAKLTELEASNRGITNLTGIDYCVNVTRLGLIQNQNDVRRLILSEYQVSEEIRRERRRRRSWATGNANPRRKGGEMGAHRTHEAATAPQPIEVVPISRKNSNSK